MGSLCGGLGFGCDDGLVCEAAQCTDAQELRRCPAHWPTRTIEVDEFGRHWCGPTTPWPMGCELAHAVGVRRHSLSCRLPEPDLYQFTVTPLDDVGSPILFLREFCDFDEALHQRELAWVAPILTQIGFWNCRWLAHRSELSFTRTTLILSLWTAPVRNGQPIWSGPYALEMVAVVQPQIDAARIVFDGARNLIGIYLRGRDRNPSTAAIRSRRQMAAPFHSRTTRLFGRSTYIQGTKMVNSLFLYGLIDVTGRVSARAARSVEAFVSDTTRLTSDGHIVGFSEPAVVQADEACDPMGLVSRCTAPQICVNATPPRCSTTVTLVDRASSQRGHR